MSQRETSADLFPPMSRAEMDRRGWDSLDVLLVTGDAYVDHPSFGAAVIARVLERAGYRVGGVAQPDWERPEEFAALGRPRLFVGITAGNMDSMLANYTGNRLPRSEDAYAPGGEAGRRPNRAALVYAQRVRQALGDVPIVLGGIEASLRRLAHYDYWEDRVRRSALVDAQADLIVYGMGERAVVEIANRLAAGEPVNALTDIRGTVYAHPGPQETGVEERDVVVLPSFETVREDKDAFNEAFRLWYGELDPCTARPVAQQHGHVRVVQNPPALPLSAEELDAVYALPFTRRWHPRYDAAGGVPALETVRWSITSHRGCFGRCAFCAIGAHQGRHIASRSVASIAAEVARLTEEPGFGGTITDVGGPTANMYGMACRRVAPARVPGRAEPPSPSALRGEGRVKGRGCAVDKRSTLTPPSPWKGEGANRPGRSRGEPCRRADCLLPSPCRRLSLDHRRQLEMLRAVRALPRVKHAFLGTGLRYDLVLADPACDEVLRELCRHHVSGQLKVAPEHADEGVLRLMRKPTFARFLEFGRRYAEVNAALGKDQHLACYYVTAHPGTGLAEAVALAEAIRDHHLPAEQVQDFTPTPMTLSTAMYFTGKDPLTGETVHVPRGARERRRQRALAQFRSRDNRADVVAALREAGRDDLIAPVPRGLLPQGPGRGRRIPAKRTAARRRRTPPPTPRRKRGV